MTVAVVLIIDRNQYPQLNAILWDTNATLIDAQRALDCYERRWPYIDKQAISDDELALVFQLAGGKNLFMPVGDF